MHFKGKVCWITGASSGIGKALVEDLARQGAILVLTSRNEARLNALKTNFSDTNIEVLVADITKIPMQILVQEALNFNGKIDYFFPAAGASQRALSADTDIEVLRYLMELNFFVPVLQTEALLKLQPRHPLHIVAFSSMAGLMGFPLRSSYAAAKHALKGYFETWQTEHIDSMHHCTIVFPGRINTSISDNALLGNGENHGIKDKGQAKGISAQDCASLILDAVARQKYSVTIARSERILYYLWWFLPKTYRSLAAKHGLDKK